MPDTSTTWISVSDTAKLTNLAPRTVRQKCVENKYKTKVTTTAKGVKKYLISLESLPDEVQIKYRSEHSKAGAREKLVHKKDWQRAIALERFEILSAWDEYAAQAKKGVSDCAHEFCEKQRKERALNPDLKVKKITRTTIYRWKKAMKKESVAALAPKWNNGRVLFQEDKFSKEAKGYVADLWLHGNQPSKKICWYKTVEKAEKENWRVPSYSTARLFLDRIPKPVKIMYRDGGKTFEDNLPMMRRDYSSVEPLQIAESDHHQVDVAVQFPDGSVGFPWMTCWFDVASRKVLADVLVSKPSGDSINVSLYELINNHGLVKEVHLDNGKDYRGKRFTGMKRGKVQWKEENFKLEYNTAYVDGLYGDLGIKVHWARPYSGRSKVIERFFKTFETEFGKWCRGYRGSNVTERPEKLKDEIKAGNIMTFSELKKAVDGYIHWYNEVRVHTGDNMNGRTPDTVFYDKVKTKYAIQPDELALLFSSYPTPKTVEMNGIYMFNDYYFNEKINFEYMGRRVLVRYAEDNIDKIFVFDLEGKYIGSADKFSKAKWGQDSEEYKKFYRTKKAITEATKDWTEKNLGQRLADVEREKLAAPVIKGKKKEPELTVKFMKTSYAAIVEEEKRMQDEENRRLERAKKLQDKYAGQQAAAVPIDSKVNNFLNNYYKD